LRSGVVSRCEMQGGWKLTSMNDIVIMEIIYSFENLSKSLRSILFGKPSLLADTVEQLSSSS